MIADSAAYDACGWDQAVFRYRMPTIAIVARTELATCQARQDARPTNRQVPAQTIARQHAGVPTGEQLLAEGFDQVHDAADLDLLYLLLARSATASFDPLAEIRATFGPDSVGVFAVAGRQLTVRRSDHAEVFDHHWQAHLQGRTCESCGGTAWVKVTDAADLLAVYNGQPPEELFCDWCDVPDWYAA
ncbi:hypothetical protein [Streptomyces sp. S186]|uniref:hypothetical protein n=1 Tax=Streptomyces sp. S186 TaxID=3434395 RepID=UPI003F66382E